MIRFGTFCQAVSNPPVEAASKCPRWNEEGAFLPGRGTPVEGTRPCWLSSSTLVVEKLAVDFPLAQRSDYTGMVRKEHGWSGGGIVWLPGQTGQRASFQRTDQVANLLYGAGYLII